MTKRRCKNCLYADVCDNSELCDYYTPLSDDEFYETIVKPEYDKIIDEEEREYWSRFSDCLFILT